jgi:hypothetical protein
MEPSLTHEQALAQKDAACSIITKHYDNIFDECEREGIHAAVVVNCLCELGMGGLLEIALGNNIQDETKVKRFIYQVINTIIANIKKSRFKKNDSYPR